MLEKLHSTKLKLHYGFAITALCDKVAKAAPVLLVLRFRMRKHPQLLRRRTSLLEEHFTENFVFTSQLACAVFAARKFSFCFAKCSRSCGTCSIESVAFKVKEYFCSQNYNLLKNLILLSFNFIFLVSVFASENHINFRACSKSCTPRSGSCTMALP